MEIKGKCRLFTSPFMISCQKRFSTNSNLLYLWRITDHSTAKFQLNRKSPNLIEYFQNGTFKKEAPPCLLPITAPSTRLALPSSPSIYYHSPMQLVDKWLGSNIAYADALQIQETKLLEVLEGSSPNTLFQLEHSPVYTIGRTRDQSSLRSPDSLPHPVVEINRGGQATYHGPGQLVGYPIVDLRPLGKDLHTYIRAIEQALINTCIEFGIPATRREGLTGVWVENRKLAAIGVGVRKWIGMHGFAINITKESLIGFLSITPCGLDGVKITCVAHEAKRDISVAEFSKATSLHMLVALNQLEV